MVAFAATPSMRWNPRAPGQELHPFAGRPDVDLEPPRVGSGGHQGKSIAVVGHAVHPVLDAPPKRRVAPDEPVPRLDQTVVGLDELPSSGSPGLTGRSAGVEIERPECLDDLWRCQPDH